jgi:uncharacterized protein with HEPN domain
LSRSDPDRLADILEAADEIAALIASGKTAWDSDRTRRLAVERLLEIVGEAARAMSQEGRERFPEVPWGDVVDLRTLLAHHYQRVDQNQVWVIATTSVPELATALREGQAGP